MNTALQLIVAPLLAILLVASPVVAQGKKPTRSAAPEFKPGQFDGVFFNDVSSVLKGELPTRQTAVQIAAISNAAPSNNSNSSVNLDSSGDPSDPMAWHNLISPTSLEDLIKGSKLRLDRVITTPAAFAGGGFQEARKEFSLQSLLFAVIETHPGDVRWKSSSGVAREAVARAAANTKVGSRQVYDEAKKRLADLGDLMNGSQLDGAAKTEIEWSKLIDRVPLMQLLEWSKEDFISTYSASETQFAENNEELQRYAELVAVLGKAAIQDGMPDANDDDYKALAHDMITQAQQIVLAVKTNNAELARQAAGKLGQSCQNCHDNFN
ncbi:MAG: cytochrome c [Pirellulaceae bacterium]